MQTAKLKKQYIVTTNAVWRKLQAMLQRLANDGRLQDPRLLEKKVGLHFAIVT